MWNKIKEAFGSKQIVQEDECDHDYSEQSFINRTDLKFQRCERCGDKQYSHDAHHKVNEGKTVTIVWPQ